MNAVEGRHCDAMTASVAHVTLRVTELQASLETDGWFDTTSLHELKEFDALPTATLPFASNAACRTSLTPHHQQLVC